MKRKSFLFLAEVRMATERGAAVVFKTTDGQKAWGLYFCMFRTKAWPSLSERRRTAMVTWPRLLKSNLSLKYFW